MRQCSIHGRAALAVTAKREKVILHPATERYLPNLKGTLGRETDHARMLLERVIGNVTLRREVPGGGFV